MKTQNNILRSRKFNRKARQDFGRKIVVKSIFVLLLSVLLSCNTGSKANKDEITIIDGAYDKSGDIDNDGIPNEFDVDFVPKQTKELLPQKEVKVFVEDTLINEKKEIKKSKNRYAIKKQPKKSKLKIPKAPVKLTLKRDIELLAVGKKRLVEVRKYFCNRNQNIIVDGKSKTFTRFYKEIKGKKIKIKSFKIKFNNSGCVSEVVLKYSEIYSFNNIKKNRPYRIAKSSNKIIGL